uniref:Putative secreted protein n=1 Tax=Anopheles darlingi TaxID=43151 RepID=A0A2M4D0C3_ANODA
MRVCVLFWVLDTLTKAPTAPSLASQPSGTNTPSNIHKLLFRRGNHRSVPYRRRRRLRFRFRMSSGRSRTTSSS